MLAEYLTLDPLQTRIDTHRRYSERPDDLEGDIDSVLGLAPEQDLLDVGCGTGAFLKRLIGSAGSLTGVDTSAAAIANLSTVEGVTARPADATALPFADGSFDVVTMRHMLYHVPSPQLAIAEAKRVLRPDGLFAAVVNIENTTPMLMGLVGAAIEAHGLDNPYFVPVHSGNLPGLVREVFGTVLVHRRDNALVFDSPEPIIAYAVSCLTTHGIADDDPRRSSIVDTIVRLARNGSGTMRDPKGYVIVTARA